MAEAPSIKEALKPCPFCGGEPDIRTRMDEDIWTHNIVKWTGVHCAECGIGFEWPPGAEPDAAEQWNTRATFQPDGERREAIARILADPKHQERARYVQGFLYGDDHVIRDVALRENQELFRTKDEHEYEQRLEIEKAKFAAGAIIASGLVQNEAGIRRDEREKCAKIAVECIENDPGYYCDSCKNNYYCPEKAAAAIRSARDGGSES